MTVTRVDFLRRLGASLSAAMLLAMVAAGLEAYWAGNARTGASFGSVFVTVLGLWIPVACLVGAGVALASLFFHPERAPSLCDLSNFLGRGTRLEQRRRSLQLLGFAPLAVGWLLLVAWLGLKLLASELPTFAVAAAAAGGGVGLWLFLALVMRGAAQTLSERSKLPLPAPNRALLIAVSGAILGFGVLVAIGSTSGGGGPLGVYGVFRRPELDLRAISLMFAVMLGSYALPALLGRWPMVVTMALGVVPIFSVYPSATSSLDDRKVRVAVEREAPFAGLVLKPFRALTDRDKDGFSAWFGGGDCDDSNPNVAPGADDVPGNGVDEDCSGEDDVVVRLEEATPPPPKNAREAALQRVPEKLNVILLTIDTLRWDLGYTGKAKHPLSPNLDRLAKHSVVFDNAYSLASYTSKSLGPMLIGKYTSETHRGFKHFNQFSKEDSFIQERLSAAGIRTLSVQGYWYFFHKGYGYERGFDLVNSEAAPKVVQVEGDRSFNSHKLSDQALELLKDPAQSSQQFFMWVHYVDPHSEYVKHDDFDFGADARARYDSEVAFVDQQIGRILDYVEQSPFKDRTAIVVTSDHGEAFGEHGMIRHGFELWEELVRVPLIFYVPGLEPRRVEQRRSAIDIVPTLLDLMRQPLPKGEANDFLSGDSLLLDLAQPNGHTPKAKIVFVDMAAGPHNAERQAFIENDYKLVVSQGRPLSLFNLAEDPGEKKDLLDDEALKEKYMRRYKAFRRALKEVKVRH